MSTREIKTLLHESIENINDEALLMTIMELLERQYSPKTDIEIRDWQIKRIEDSKQQLKDGKFHTEDEANDTIDKWLSE